MSSRARQGGDSLGERLHHSILPPEEGVGRLMALPITSLMPDDEAPLIGAGLNRRAGTRPARRSPASGPIGASAGFRGQADRLEIAA